MNGTAGNTAYTIRSIALALRDILLSQNVVYAENVRCRFGFNMRADVEIDNFTKKTNDSFRQNID
jgi:hypothetical protein